MPQAYAEFDVEDADAGQSAAESYRPEAAGYRVDPPPTLTAADD